MKKRLSLLIALVMLLAFVLPTIAACDKDKVVDKIEVVDPVTEFYLGDANTIDYDNLKLKVTYEDSTSETKTVKEWGATHTEANLNKEGTTSYTVTYGGKSCVVSVTVKVKDSGTKDTVTVTFKHLDGSTPDDVSQLTKGEKAALFTPKRDNYNFDGWYTKDGTTSGDWGSKWNEADPVNENLTLYAKWTKQIITYVVYFNDGTKTESRTVVAGETVTFPTEPTKDRYDFGGWFTKDGTDGDYGEEWTEQKPVTATITLYAKWIAKQYTQFTFEYLDGTTHSTDTTAEVERGEALGSKLPQPQARDGYRFDGWYTQNGTANGDWGEEWTADKQTTADDVAVHLYAKWGVTRATVKFDYNYPSGVQGQPAAIEVSFTDLQEDSTIGKKLPTLTENIPAHYDFVGWFTDRSAGEEVEETTLVNGDVTYYAHWSRRTVTVTFKYNDGGATPDKQVTINEGDSLGSQFPTEPEYTKHRFDGWRDESNGDRRYESNTAIDSSLTLTAHWVEQVTVTFNLNYEGAQGTPDPVTVDIHTALGTKFPTDPTHEKVLGKTHTFDGWFENEQGTGTKWNNATQVTKDVTLYAKWIEDAATFEVTFNPGEGQLPQEQQQTVTVVEGSTVNTPTPTRLHYHFDGWFTQNGDEHEGDWGKEFTNETTVLGAKTVYAKWSKQIQVYVNKGYDVDVEKLEPTYVDPNGTLQLSDLNNTREGYIFDGWFTELSGGDPIVGNVYTVGSDGDVPEYVYAHWTREIVTVILDYLDKNESERVDVEWGSDLDLTQYVPTTMGKTFEAWYQEQDLQTIVPEQKLTNVTEPTTVYAKWRETVALILVLNNGQETLSTEIPANATLINYTLYKALVAFNPAFTNVLPTDAFPAWQLCYYEGDLLADLVKNQGNLTNFMIFTLKPQLMQNLIFKVKTSASVTGEAGKIDSPVYPQHTFGANKPVKAIQANFDFDWGHYGAGVELPWPAFGVLEKQGPYASFLPDNLKNIDLRLQVTGTTWLYANWSETEGAQQHNVTFHYNDGTDNKYETKVYEGATILLPGPTRNGYTFDGWWTKNGGESANDTDWGTKWEETTTISGDTELWARWKKESASFVVTLNNGVETRSFTVKEGNSLQDEAKSNADLQAFLATADSWTKNGEPFDLAEKINSSITLVAQSKESLTGVVLSFSAPDFYLNYKQRSTTEGDSLGYFKTLRSTYEVGTVNKFIFRPVVRIRTTQGVVTEYNPQTTAVVEFSDVAGSGYAAHDEWVTKGNNTYKFSDEADGKYVKLTISLSGAGYTIPGSVKNEVTAEFKLVKGGYNVYDQRGLSVMNDLQQKIWSPLWGVTANIVRDESLNREDAYKYKVEFSNTDNAVQLAADDQPLYKYVGNVDWVILHNDIDLDPTQMPQEFFWQAGDQLYYSAYQSLAGWSHQQELLVGSLKDGDNSGNSNFQNYMPMYDLSPESEFAAIGFGVTVNMQKGFYSTSKVSVSGNYFSLTHILERGNRRLQNYVDWDDDTKIGDPVPHWSVFQLMTNKNTDAPADTRGTLSNPFTVKNIAMKGSTPQKDYYDQGKTIYFAPAGIMLANTYSSIKFDNINANNFFTAIVGDNYGEENDAFRTKYEVTNSKIYDAYSNMVYTWRGNIEISNSEMVGSGGPLFIMCDGLRDEGDSYNKVDTDGPTLTVSGTCRLEAYATGAESWYDANNASQLVTTMRGAVETDLFNDAGKTIRWVKKEGKMVPYSKGDENMNQYINVLAVMICSPGNLISGWDKHVLDVRGTTSFGGENEYHMHNDFANIVREKTQKNGANYLLLVQMGNNWLATDLANSINPTVDGITKYFDKAASFGDSVSAEQKQLASYASWDNPQTDILSHFGKWRQLDANNYQNKVCVYLSAGVISHSALAPYFGVILDIGNYQG